MAGIVTETNLKDVVGDPVEYVRDGILHDVGKIRVDNRILDYPGRLDDTKMNEIKSHPVDGFELVHTFHSVFKGKPSENLAVRILLSHYAQPNMYPDRLEIAEKLAAYNIDPSLPEDTDYMMGSLGLDIADHFEARFPNSKKSGSAHGYGKRKYRVGILPKLVTANFLEAEVVDELGFINGTPGQLDERLFDVITYCGGLATKAERIKLQ